MQTLINDQLEIFSRKLQKEIDRLNEAIERNEKMVKEVQEKITSIRSSADKILTEQMGEYMDIIVQYKNEKMYYEEDLSVLEYVYQKDLRPKLKLFNQLRTTKDEKELLTRLIQRIYQGNDEVIVSLRLNAFIPFTLYNDFTYEKHELRNNIAYKYNNKYIKPLFL